VFIYTKSILFFICLLGFVSCGPRKLENRKERTWQNERHLKMGFLFELLEDYVDTLRDYKYEKKNLKNEIKDYITFIRIIHEVNAKYNDYLENKNLIKNQLIEIKSKVAEIKNQDGVSQEVLDASADVEEKLQTLIDQDFMKDINWQRIEISLTEASEESESASEEVGAVEELESASEEAGAVEELESVSEEAGAVEELESVSEEAGAVEELE